MAVVLLALSLTVSIPAGTADDTECGVVLGQDDAGSNRDAGASSAHAVELDREAVYSASVSYPRGPVIDAEDWFQASWSGDAERRVMVNLTMHGQGYGYMVADELPAPHLGLEAYAPGADEATHTGTAGEDGVVRLDFTTQETGTWHFRVFLPADVEPSCPSQGGVHQASTVQAYDLYWGCHPHCITVSTS